METKFNELVSILKKYIVEAERCENNCKAVESNDMGTQKRKG
jgi:hypothetical protein